MTKGFLPYILLLLMFLVAEFAKDVILVLPVLADLDPEVEIDRSAQDLLQFPCRILLGRLQEASVLSDDSENLALANIKGNSFCVGRST